MAGFKEYVHATALAGGLTLAAIAVTLDGDQGYQGERTDCLAELSGKEQETCLDTITASEASFSEVMSVVVGIGCVATAWSGYGAYKNRRR